MYYSCWTKLQVDQWEITMIAIYWYNDIGDKEKLIFTQIDRKPFIFLWIIIINRALYMARIYTVSKEQINIMKLCYTSFFIRIRKFVKEGFRDLLKVSIGRTGGFLTFELVRIRLLSGLREIGNKSDTCLYKEERSVQLRKEMMKQSTPLRKISLKHLD